jgi:hypothetical protein
MPPHRIEWRLRAANRPNMLGSGKAGVSAGTSAPARWIRVQIGQKSSARSSRPVGLDGALISSLDCALASAVAPTDTDAMWSRCTCPMETASWKASTNSARQDPNLERDRNQCIISFARLAPGRTTCAGIADNCSYNVTLQQPAQSRFILCVTQNHHRTT